MYCGALFRAEHFLFVLVREVLQMLRIIGVAARFALVLAVALTLGVAGCGGSKTGGGGGGGGGGGAKSSKGSGKKLNDAEQARLDEARKSAEDAERKLSELRLERIQLEGRGK
jgi:hypothetical protein